MPLSHREGHQSLLTRDIMAQKNYIDTSRRKDRIAELLIRIGGVAVIVSVVWILVMISRVALPLFFQPTATVAARVDLSGLPQSNGAVAVGTDENQRAAFVLDSSGMLQFVKLPDGTRSSQESVPNVPPGGGRIRTAEHIGGGSYTLLWDTGAVTGVTIGLATARQEDGSWSVSPEVSSREDLSFPAAAGVMTSSVRTLEGKGAVRVDHMADGRLRVTHRVIEKDLLGNEKQTGTVTPVEDSLPGALSVISVDTRGHYLYAGTANGWLLRWDISEPGHAVLLESVPASPGGHGISSLAPVLGDVSIAVGDTAGNISTWFPVKVAGSGDDRRLTRIHTLSSLPGAVTAIIPSPRDKTLFAAGNGMIQAGHMTSERTLLKLESTPAQMTLSPKGTTLASRDSTGRLTVWKLDIPHPEISIGTLLGRIWYEGYDKPEYAWQSSAANDDFEPKLSLIPLVFGTVKATLFAMIFAVPLALTGALYTSQFMTPKLKGRVKPVVEIMAAIPSVVIGFLAGLWLAPLIDSAVLTVFLSLVFVPLALLGAIALWRTIRTASPLQRRARGNEFLVLIPVVLAGVLLAFAVSGSVEARFFAGDFKQWLYSTLGVRYDQRNSIIIAIALGFAVIPIIFTIAEDAISNVPRNLTAASLALGASRWQTAWRVVLPSALPGVFSAIMIGFGRAIGETMIVLMATGNTPIMSWSLFNGLRSLSANIAVEIPEAPLNSSLYRTLFLSAVLLFVFTFIINTVAEALRQKFRKKYGRY